MRRSSVLDLVRLQVAFEAHGRHDRVADYLAQPRVSLGANTSSFIMACTVHLEARTPFDQLPVLGYAPHDSTIFKRRFDAMATNNRAYSLCMKILPSVEELEELAEILWGWAGLFPIKVYSLCHPDVCRAYRGLLPFGGPVKFFYNKVPLGNEITGTPSFQDHIRLRDVSNDMADQMGCTSMHINNEMYLDGERMKNGN